jgi:hypothetical protein
VQTVCTSGTSAYSGAVKFNSGGCAINYCSSKGITNYEYISSVSVGGINNISGDNGGYGNFTNMVASINPGAVTSITLTPGYHGPGYTEFWTVYIDYNQNGLFTDAGEMVLQTSSSSAITKTFTVPASALTGNTRMRIQMQYGLNQTNPCASFSYGEVEDYTVNIGAKNKLLLAPDEENANTLTDNNEVSSIRLYPNPAQQHFTFEYEMKNAGVCYINIYNLAGQKIIAYEKNAGNGLNTEEINTGLLMNGTYICELDMNGEIRKQKFVVLR